MSIYRTIKWRVDTDLQDRYTYPSPYTGALYKAIAEIGQNQDLEGVDVSIVTIYKDDGYSAITMILSVTLHIDAHGVQVVDGEDQLKFFKNHIDELTSAKVFILEELIRNNRSY